MNARDRRRRLYERISEARDADPEVFARRGKSPEIIARQALRSSRIEGCKVEFDRLLQIAEKLESSRYGSDYS